MRSKSPIRSIILVVVILGLLIFLHFSGILSPIENFTLRPLVPVQATVYSWGLRLSYIPFWWQRQNELAEKIQKLENQIVDLTQKNVRLKSLEEENKILREGLNFFERQEYKFVLSRIIGKSPDTSSVIILNKGRADGISENLPIVVSSGVLVGKIIEVDEYSSKASLLTDSRSKVAAFVQNKEEACGIVEGKYNLGMKMTLIPQTEEINPQDVVLTSGIENIFPKGLIIGKISKVEKEEGGLFQNATVEEIVPFNKLSIVAVLVPQ